MVNTGNGRNHGARGAKPRPYANGGAAGGGRPRPFRWGDPTDITPGIIVNDDASKERLRSFADRTANMMRESTNNTQVGIRYTDATSAMLQLTDGTGDARTERGDVIIDHYRVLRPSKGRNAAAINGDEYHVRAYTPLGHTALPEQVVRTNAEIPGTVRAIIDALHLGPSDDSPNDAAAPDGAPATDHRHDRAEDEPSAATAPTHSDGPIAGSYAPGTGTDTASYADEEEAGPSGADYGDGMAAVDGSARNAARRADDPRGAIDGKWVEAAIAETVAPSMTERRRSHTKEERDEFLAGVLEHLDKEQAEVTAA